MTEPITNEEAGPAAAGKKIEQQVQKSFEDTFNEIMQQDQEAKEQELRVQYDSIKKHGFITQKEMDEKIDSVAKTFVQEIKKLHDENLKLLEAFKKGRSRGISGGALDQEQQQQEESALKAWERPFYRNMKR